MEGLRNKDGLTEKEFLEKYNPRDYIDEMPSVTADILLFTLLDDEQINPRKLPDKNLHILMIKRGDHPFMGKWALPGGFVTKKESLEQAAIRELQEETNIGNVYLEQLYAFGDLGRDPRTQIISISYMALVDSTKLDIKASSDADDAKWFKVDFIKYDETKEVKETGYVLERKYKLELSCDDEVLSAIIKETKSVENGVSKVKRELVESVGFAFDHALIISYGVARLRKKVWHTPIVFSLMPELFTIGQLQKAYEGILGVDLIDSNFRKRIEQTAKMVVETNEKIKIGAYRPATAYRFNPEWEDDEF